MLPGTALTTEMKMKQLGILPPQHKPKFNTGVAMYKIQNMKVQTMYVSYVF